LNVKCIVVAVLVAVPVYQCFTDWIFEPVTLGVTGCYILHDGVVVVGKRIAATFAIWH